MAASLEARVPLTQHNDERALCGSVIYELIHSHSQRKKKQKRKKQPGRAFSSA